MRSTSNILIAMEAGAMPARTSIRAFPERLSGIAQRLWRAYWDNQARRATMMLLHALDDRALADIGFKRSEIESAVLGSSADRARLYDPKWHPRTSSWRARRALAAGNALHHPPLARGQTFL